MDELEAIQAKKMQEMLRRSRSPEKPVQATDATFGEVVGRGLVLVDCWAEWCGACRMIEPTIEGLAREYAGRVTFAKLNVDENPETTSRFGVMSIPTLLVFKNSRLVDTIVGAVPKTEIVSVLERYL
ncbi:thioredoxin [Candidatus Bathyarchaeota archaeon]|nr:thioredoxin [Candidatus Bathyarchaeota archaeon]